MADIYVDLSNQVRGHQAFWDDYRWLSSISLKRLVKTKSEEVFEEKSISRLLRSATIFAKSGVDEFRNDAQDIAYAMLALNPPAGVVAMCKHVLSGVGNFPARAFLDRQNLTGTGAANFSPEGVPLTLDFEEWGRREFNTIGEGESEVALTDFQAQLWSALDKKISVAVSAPTSAGKSFVLQQFLKQQLGRPEISSVIYLAPSRALISEVQGNLTRALQHVVRDVRITSVPTVLEGEDVPKKSLYVLTQERLQVLLADTEVHFDIVIVDEAQQISEGARGIILHSSLEELRQRCPNALMMFLTPGASNAGDFRRIFDVPQFETLSSSLRPVRQNLVFVEFDRFAPKELKLSLAFRDGRLDLGRVVTSTSFVDASKRLTTVALELGKEGQSLIYAGGAAKSEEFALRLAGSLSPIASQELEELSKFTKDHIHPDYALAETVKHGVAFHYGVMPTVLRQAIEENFAQGHIKYLACTSTLLQGVNLPARNIFLMKPERGRSQPIDAEGFWNLAGRAGRLGKDIEGNVFLVDYDSWQSKPLDGDRSYSIKPALAEQLSEHREGLLEFIEDQSHPSGRFREFEGAVTKLYLDFKAGNLERTLSRLNLSLLSPEQKRLTDALAHVAQRVTLPSEIVSRCGTVSPFRQQDLYEYFVEKIEKNEVDSLIPIHPVSAWEDAKESLTKVLKRIHTYLEKKPSKDRSQFYFAPLALRWMRGDSLPKLIQDRVDYLRAKRKVAKTATVIRDVLNEVEQDLRFRYVEYTGCYNELLAYALSQKGLESKVQSIPGLPLYLELGACTGTMVSFIELGLSRISAREFSRFINDPAVSTKSAREWIRKTNLRAFDISPVVVGEARRLGLITS